MPGVPGRHRGRPAQVWLDSPPGSAIDGVVVNADTLAYEPGSRVMRKVKRMRSVDCVVARFRVTADGQVSSLMLGPYDADGTLQHVGEVTALSRRSVRCCWRRLRRW